MIIKLKVKTGASKNEINKIDENNWEIKTTKNPNDNEANLAIIDMISKSEKIAKSRVIIVSGSKSKQKTIELI